MGIIEQWGTGLQRMIRGCREYGVQEPEFVNMGDAFRVNFYRPNIETDIKKTEISSETDIEMTKTSKESGMTGIENIETDTEMIEDELFFALSDSEKKVVRLILKDSEITQDKIADIVGMSKSGIRYVMNKLKNKGILVRVGATKKGKWSIELFRKDCDGIKAID